MAKSATRRDPEQKRGAAQVRRPIEIPSRSRLRAVAVARTCFGASPLAQADVATASLLPGVAPSSFVSCGPRERATRRERLALGPSPHTMSEQSRADVAEAGAIPASLPLPSPRARLFALLTLLVLFPARRGSQEAPAGGRPHRGQARSEAACGQFFARLRRWRRLTAHRGGPPGPRGAARGSPDVAGGPSESVWGPAPRGGARRAARGTTARQGPVRRSFGAPSLVGCVARICGHLGYTVVRRRAPNGGPAGREDQGARGGMCLRLSRREEEWRTRTRKSRRARDPARHKGAARVGSA